MGPALTLPNALSMLGQSYPPGSRKNMAFAVFGGTAPFGAIAGFLFGGIFALVWWPWIYWSQAIALASLTLLATRAIPTMPNSPIKERSWKSILEHLDLLGGMLGVAGLASFNFAWNQAVVVSWKEPYVYVCLVLGVVLGIVFFWYETKLAKYPILPLAFFSTDIAVVFACTSTGWACFGIWASFASRRFPNI